MDWYWTSIKFLQELPENVVPTITDRDFVVATVAAPTVIKELEKPTEETPAEGADGEAPAEGAEAATKEVDGAKKDEKSKKVLQKNLKIKNLRKNLLEKIIDMLLLVGLGNPETDYTNTRHNIGFKIIDAINTHFKLSTKAKIQRFTYNREYRWEKNLCN